MNQVMRVLVKSKHRWDDNIKVGLKEIEWGFGLH